MMNDPILGLIFKIGDKRGCRIRDVLDMSETEFLGWTNFYFGQQDEVED